MRANRSEFSAHVGLSAGRAVRAGRAPARTVAVPSVNDVARFAWSALGCAVSVVALVSFI